jgi:preprotein translocase subunit SecB
MAQQTQYPFKLNNVFFGRVALERAPKMPEEEIKINFEVQVKVIDEQFPDVLEVQLRVETSDEQPVKMNVIVVGKFVPIEGFPEPDHSIVRSFVNERALHTLWAYLDQIVTQVSAQMGMEPIRLISPPEFNYSPQEESSPV